MWKTEKIQTVWPLPPKYRQLFSECRLDLDRPRPRPHSGSIPPLNGDPTGPDNLPIPSIMDGGFHTGGRYDRSEIENAIGDETSEVEPETSKIQRFWSPLLQWLEDQSRKLLGHLFIYFLASCRKSVPGESFVFQIFKITASVKKVRGFQRVTC